MPRPPRLCGWLLTQFVPWLETSDMLVFCTIRDKMAGAMLVYDKSQRPRLGVLLTLLSCDVVRRISAVSITVPSLTWTWIELLFWAGFWTSIGDSFLFSSSSSDWRWISILHRFVEFVCGVVVRVLLTVDNLTGWYSMSECPLRSTGWYRSERLWLVYG